jgi:hypothetical protein
MPNRSFDIHHSHGVTWVKGMDSFILKMYILNLEQKISSVIVPFPWMPIHFSAAACPTAQKKIETLRFPLEGHIPQE